MTTTELKDERAKLTTDYDAKIAAAEKFQNELARHQRAVDQAEDDVTTCEAFRSSLEERLAQAKVTSFNLLPFAVKTLDHFHQLYESHVTRLALLSIIDELPKWRQVLLAQLKKAQDALGDFQRRANK